MALDQSVNLDSKATGGRAYRRHQSNTRSSGTLVPDVPRPSSNYNSWRTRDSDRVGAYRENAPRWMVRDDDDVWKLLTVITSRPMPYPLSLDEDDDDISPLINVATCLRMPFDRSQITRHLTDVLSYELSAVPVSLVHTYDSF